MNKTAKAVEKPEVVDAEVVPSSVPGVPEPDSVDPANELTPAEDSGALSSANYHDDIHEVAENVDRYLKDQETIMLAILKKTKDKDWVIHDGKGSLGYAGCLRAARVIGLNFGKPECTRYDIHDDAGKGYRWECLLEAWVERRDGRKGRSIYVFGRYSSRDKFLGRKDGEWRELSAINEGDVKMAAIHRAEAEAVKTFLGIHSMPVDYLKKHGVDLTDAKNVNYNSKSKTKKPPKNTPTQKAVFKIKNIAVKDLPKRDKPGEVVTKYSITGSNQITYGTFSESHKDVAVEAQKTGEMVEAEFTVHPTWGPQLINMKKANGKGATNGNQATA